MTDAERKAAERSRKRAAGLAPVEIWVPVSRVQEIREIAAKMVAEQKDTES